jgi:hypothetical protein
MQQPWVVVGEGESPILITNSVKVPMLKMQECLTNDTVLNHCAAAHCAFVQCSTQHCVLVALDLLCKHNASSDLTATRKTALHLLHKHPSNIDK